jgi:hypothetical protein
MRVDDHPGTSQGAGDSSGVISSDSVAPRSATQEPARPREPRSFRAKRVLLAGTSAFVAVNIWTGAPLLALWVGSRLVGQTSLSMQGVMIVVAVLALVVFALTVVLVRINQIYLDLVNVRRDRRQPQWLSHLGEEPEREATGWAAFNTIERILVASVYVAAITLVIWFFFIAGSPLPQ